MSRTSIVVFHMHGCPACEEYIPKLKAVARRHPTVPVHVLEAGQYPSEAEAFQVSAVPVTFVLKGRGFQRKEGALSPDEIEYAFKLAEHYA